MIVTQAQAVAQLRAKAESAVAFRAEPPTVSMSEPEAMALVAGLAMQDNQAQVAREKVDRASTERADRIRRMRAAMAEANRCRKKKGFWGKVASTAKTVGLLAGAAATVAAASSTGGASLLVTGMLIAAALSAERVMNAVGCNPDINVGPVKMKMSDLVILGCAAGSGCVATQGASGSWIKYAEVGARGTQAGATGTEAYATYEGGQWAGRAGHSDADARSFELDAEHQQSEANDAVVMLRNAAASRQRAIETLTEVIQTKHAARKALMGMRA
jgi:hypothetical protein